MYVLENCSQIPSDLYCSYDDSRVLTILLGPNDLLFSDSRFAEQYYFCTVYIIPVYIQFILNRLAVRTTGRPSGTCRYHIIFTIIYFNLTRLPRLPGHMNSWPKYVHRTKTVNFFRTN